MNAKALLKKYGHLPPEQLPAALQARLDANPAAKQQFEAHQRVAGLLALKRTEQPAPELEGRVRYVVKTRIAQGDFPAPTPQPPSLATWLQIGAVAALMVALGVFAVLDRASDPASTLAGQSNAEGEADNVIIPVNVDPFLTVPTGPGVLAADDTGLPPLGLRVREADSQNPFSTWPSSNAVPELPPQINNGVLPVTNPLNR